MASPSVVSSAAGAGTPASANTAANSSSYSSMMAAAMANGAKASSNNQTAPNGTPAHSGSSPPHKKAPSSGQPGPNPNPNPNQPAANTSAPAGGGGGGAARFTMTNPGGSMDSLPPGSLGSLSGGGSSGVMPPGAGGGAGGSNPSAPGGASGASTNGKPGFDFFNSNGSFPSFGSLTGLTASMGSFPMLEHYMASKAAMATGIPPPAGHPGHHPHPGHPHHQQQQQQASHQSHEGAGGGSAKEGGAPSGTVIREATVLDTTPLTNGAMGHHPGMGHHHGAPSSGHHQAAAQAQAQAAAAQAQAQAAAAQQASAAYHYGSHPGSSPNPAAATTGQPGGGYVPPQYHMAAQSASPQGATMSPIGGGGGGPNAAMAGALVHVPGGLSGSSDESKALATTTPAGAVALPNGQQFVDITEHLNLPQSEAAKLLGIPPSTLSKRWKEAVRNRKWPWRVVCKLDKEIMTLLHNIPQGDAIPEDIEARLAYLLRKRQEELRPVVIRL